MHTYQPRWVVKRRGNIFQRNGRGVRRHDAPRLHALFSSSKYRLFNRRHFSDSLDQQICGCQPLTVRVSDQPIHCRVYLLGRFQPALIKGPCPINRPVNSGRIHILQGNMKSIHRSDSGNITPHDTSANHMDMTDPVITTPAFLDHVIQLENAPKPD